MTRCVDITLFKWIRYDNSTSKFVTKYMPEPYEDESNVILYDLIKKEAPAPEDWLEYNVKIVGHASKLKTVLEVYKNLQTL